MAGKVTETRSDLDAVVDGGPVDVTLAMACPVLTDKYQSVQLEDVGRTLGEVKASSCVLDPCLSWLSSAARRELAEWTRGRLKCFRATRQAPACLKKTILKPLWKKPSLDPAVLTSLQYSIFWQRAGGCSSFSTPRVPE